MHKLITLFLAITVLTGCTSPGGAPISMDRNGERFEAVIQVHHWWDHEEEQRIAYIERTLGCEVVIEDRRRSPLRTNTDQITYEGRCVPAS